MLSFVMEQITHRDKWQAILCLFDIHKRVDAVMMCMY